MGSVSEGGVLGKDAVYRQDARSQRFGYVCDDKYPTKSFDLKF